MNCPACNSPTRVVESRSARGGLAVRRRRECSGCGRRFTTFEQAERGPLYVRKRDGEAEPFDREKLRGALLKAAHKRPVDVPDVERIVRKMEAEITAAGGELPSRRIGELVLSELRELDFGAYLQFAGTMPDINPEIAGSPLAGSVRLEEDGS